MQIGDRVHALATLHKDDKSVFRFFCDQQNQACAPLDMSLPAHAEAAASDDGSYVWEYVKACTIDTQPCSAQHAPSILLRRCPAGTVLINSTQSRGFDPALQECSPCGRGNYIVDPFFGPCVKCPEGADCPGMFRFCTLLRACLDWDGMDANIFTPVCPQTAHSLSPKSKAPSGRWKSPMMMGHGPGASQSALAALPWSANRAIPRQIAASSAREALTLHIRCARHPGVATKASRV